MGSLYFEGELKGDRHLFEGEGGRLLKMVGPPLLILYKGCPYKRPLQMEALTDLIW